VEIATVSQTCLRIKGKRASLIIDPDKTLRVKTTGDAVVVLNTGEDVDTSKIEGQRLIIRGVGEYEVGGIKIAASKVEKDLFYQILVDGVTIALANAGSIERLKEKLGGHHVLLFNADAKVDQALIATLEPRVVILYGENIADLVDAVKTQKYTVTLEKLPEKMQTVLLQ